MVFKKLVCRNCGLPVRVELGENVHEATGLMECVLFADAAPRPSSAEELRLKDGYQRLAEHYVRQLGRVPLREREVLKRVILDLDEMSKRKGLRGILKGRI